MNKVHLLVADSHDSFVYNLVEILRKCPNCTFDVVATEHCPALPLENYRGILLSPGPGHPEEVKGLMPLIARTVHTHSLLGVCLGHQALALHFGGQLLQMPHPLHGHAERLTIKGVEGRTLLEQLPIDSSVGRYHSWCVAEEPFPNVLAMGLSWHSVTKHSPYLGYNSTPRATYRPTVQVSYKVGYPVSRVDARSCSAPLCFCFS